MHNNRKAKVAALVSQFLIWLAATAAVNPIQNVCILVFTPRFSLYFNLQKSPEAGVSTPTTTNCEVARLVRLCTPLVCLSLWDGDMRMRRCGSCGEAHTEAQKDMTTAQNETRCTVKVQHFSLLPVTKDYQIIFIIFFYLGSSKLNRFLLTLKTH